MLEILLFLGVATTLVLGWWRGNVFACVALTLLALALTALIAASGGGPAVAVMLLLFMIIWAPNYLRFHHWS